MSLTYADRCERYARQRGWAYDEHRMSISHLTPAQRRRALHKERRAWRGYGDEHRYDDVAFEPYDYNQDPHDLGYCVTPGCNCCGDDE